MSKKYLLLFSLIFVFSISLFIPKKSKAVTNHVVISQVQVGGATATDEFVEIYNPTADVIDLTGYKLTKKISSGTQSTLIASMSGTINQNSYLLLGHTDYAGTASKDKAYSSNSVTANNTVILYSDNGTTVIDKVGFGIATDFETSVYPNSPANGQSIRRINNQDTDNNSNDFELLQVSSPRNSNYVLPTSSPTPTPIPTPIEPEPTETPIVTTSPTPFPTPTATPTLQPTSSNTPTIKPSATPKYEDENDDKHHEVHLPFGFKCKFEKHEFEFKKHHFKYFRFSFHRH